MEIKRPPKMITRVMPAIALCAATTAHAQRGFDLNVNAFLDSTRTTATRVTVEVPLYNLIFFKKQGLFDARYEVYLSVEPLERDERASTYVLLGSATVKTYDETRKRDLRSRASLTIPLEPGEYRVDAALHVKDTRRVMRRSVTLQVPDFLSSGIGFGTPKVLSVASLENGPLVKWRDFLAANRAGGVQATSQSDPALAAFDYQPAVRFELYLDSAATDPVPCNVYYELVDSRDQQVLYGKREVEITGRDDAYLLAFNVDRLEPGVYKVNLRASTEKKRHVATASTRLRVDVTRSMLGSKFDDTLEILSLIASNDELRPLREAAAADRPAAWAEFWRRRDPDPTTAENEALEEHMRRVNYVSRNFSRVGEGWRTDRGRVYIRFGEPEEISTATDARNRGEYLIWHYYVLNRTFVFYDMFGLGDYRLVEGDVF